MKEIEKILERLLKIDVMRRVLDLSKLTFIGK